MTVKELIYIHKQSKLASHSFILSAAKCTFLTAVF